MDSTSAGIIKKAHRLLGSGDFEQARRTLKRELERVGFSGFDGLTPHSPTGALTGPPAGSGTYAVQAGQLIARSYLLEGDDDKFLDSCKDLTRHFPDVARHHHLLGVAFSRLYRWPEAQNSFRAAISANPDDVSSVENLGIALDADGWHRESYSSLLGVLRRHGRLGRGGFPVLIRNALLLGDRRTAFDAIRLIQEQSPDDPAIMHLDARVAFAHSDNTGGKKLLDRAHRKHPGNPDILADLGIHALASGHVRRAARYLRKALKADPRHAGAHYVLADMGGGYIEGADDDRAGRLRDIAGAMDAPAVPWIKKAELGFAAGKVHDSLGQYDEAFACYDAANRRIWARLPGGAHNGAPDGEAGDAKDSTDSTAIFRTVMATFDRDFFDSRFDSCFDSGATQDTGSEPEGGTGMVFLVGMPRSGTTLLEQLLSGLPAVTAGGEPGDIAALAQRLGGDGGDDGAGGGLVSLSAPEIRALSRERMSVFHKLAPPGTWRTNKEMQLFLRLGMIAVLFPAAKIIHIRRHPVDTCVSAYFQFFKLYHQQFSFNLPELGRYYRAYVDIMDHWMSCLPMDIHRVDYEALIRDPEQVIMGIADFCGMEWRESCLDPSRPGSVVNTASIWQVRQGLNRNSAGRWRRYEKHLGPLLDALGDISGL